jgi:hypothetical protein
LLRGLQAVERGAVDTGSFGYFPGGTFTVRVSHVPGDHVRAEVQDAGSEWHGDIPRSASHPHGLYLLVALASACGTGGSGRSRTVWFRLDEPAGRELP